MAVADIDEKKANQLMNNIMLIIESEKPHTAMASLAQVIKVLSHHTEITFEEMMSDITTIHDVMYANSKIEKVEKGK